MTSNSAAIQANGHADAATGLRAVLDEQRRAFLAAGPPSAAIRIDRIDRVIDLIVSNADALLDALVCDYGHRSRAQSMLSDVVRSVAQYQAHAQARAQVDEADPLRHGSAAARRGASMGRLATPGCRRRDQPVEFSGVS